MTYQPLFTCVNNLKSYAKKKKGNNRVIAPNLNCLLPLAMYSILKLMR